MAETDCRYCRITIFLCVLHSYACFLTKKKKGSYVFEGGRIDSDDYYYDNLRNQGYSRTPSGTNVTTAPEPASAVSGKGYLYSSGSASSDASAPYATEIPVSPSQLPAASLSLGLDDE